jgi:hypothetical protein
MRKFRIVLSLCDGISCGYLALKRGGFKFDKYYASEINDSAIKITKHNNKDIIHLGDLTKWREWNIDWKSVDLILAGTPCQALSNAGKRKGFVDPRSSLFHVFAEILEHVKSLNPEVKYLLENVRMKREYLDIIIQRLGVFPRLINSKSVTFQNRERYYWFNFPYIPIPNNLGVKIGDVIPNAIGGFGRRGVNKGKKKPNGDISWEQNDGTTRKDEVLNAITTSKGNTSKIKFKNGFTRSVTIDEAELAQTLPVGYTNVPGVSQTKRWHGIGNGWTVDVIKYILDGLK